MTGEGDPMADTLPVTDIWYGIQPVAPGVTRLQEIHLHEYWSGSIWVIQADNGKSRRGSGRPCSDRARRIMLQDGTVADTVSDALPAFHRKGGVFPSPSTGAIIKQ